MYYCRLILVYYYLINNNIDSSGIVIVGNYSDVDYYYYCYCCYLICSPGSCHTLGFWEVPRSYRFRFAHIDDGADCY